MLNWIITNLVIKYRSIYIFSANIYNQLISQNLNKDQKIENLNKIDNKTTFKIQILFLELKVKRFCCVQRYINKMSFFKYKFYKYNFTCDFLI